MAKINYSAKNRQLRKEIEIKIQNKILRKGVKSDFKSDNVLKVKENQFNLDGGRYLVEVGYNELIDSNGYNYAFDVLGTEEFCQLADEIL